MCRPKIVSKEEKCQFSRGYFIATASFRCIWTDQKIRHLYQVNSLRQETHGSNHVSGISQLITSLIIPGWILSWHELIILSQNHILKVKIWYMFCIMQLFYELIQSIHTLVWIAYHNPQSIYQLIGHKRPWKALLFLIKLKWLNILLLLSSWSHYFMGTCI